MGWSSPWGGDWTVVKLATLENYLKAYTTALRKRFSLAYIDAFAGSGRVPLKKSATGPTEIDGSAIRALRLPHPFESYIFIDANKENLRKLKERVDNEFSQRNVFYLHGDANQILQEFCANQKFWRPERRAVIFLDPFALNVEWKTLEAISKTKKADLWYLFSIGAVLRLLPRRELPVDPKWREKLTKILGTENWQHDLYEPPAQASLPFEPSKQERVREKGAEAVLRFVADRLRMLFSGYVRQDPVLLRDAHNRLLFALFFATANPSEAAKRLANRFATGMLDKDAFRRVTAKAGCETRQLEP